MKSTNHIAEQLRQMRVVADAIPLYCSQSIAVPGIVDGQPLLGFIFYPASGEAGRPKAIHPPVAKVVVDKCTGLVREIAFAPWIWRDGVDHTTVLGHFPGPELRNESLSDVDRLFQQYGVATDQLLSSVPEKGLQASDHWSNWIRCFDRVREDGLLPYFAFEGFPLSEVLKTCDATVQTSDTSSKNTASNHFANANALQQHEVNDALRTAEQIRNFLRDTKQPNELIDSWARSRRLLDTTAFSVAVVGEFSRGKSSLVNDLIGEQLLPVGDLPTTASLTRIAAGTKRSLTKISRSGQRQTQDLLAGEEAVLVQQSGSEESHVLQLEVENDWLRQSSLYLYDTPGAGDLSDVRIKLLSESIANCDGTVIAVSALSPLSLTEQNFVEEHVFYHHIPNIALVVTRLDQVPQKDRISVVRFIIEKARNWTSKAEVWIAADDSCLASTFDLPIGSVAIRQRLSQWSQSSQRGRDRLNQMVEQMLELMSVTYAGIELQHEISLKAVGDRQDTVRLATNRINSQKLQWDSFAIELERRSLTSETAIEDALKKQLKDLESRLCVELTRCAKPHDWWQHDFPFRLNQEFRSIAGQLNRGINQRIETDCIWLNQSVQKAFNETNGSATECSADISLSLPTAASHATGDMSRYQNYGRVISGMVTAAGFVLFGPVAGGASILGGLVTDRIFKGKTEEQKVELQKLLQHGLQQVSTEVVASSRQWINSAYSRIAKRTQMQGAAWLQTQLLAINRDVPPHVDLASQLITAESLSNELRKIAGANS